MTFLTPSSFAIATPAVGTIWYYLSDLCSHQLVQLVQLCTLCASSLGLTFTYAIREAIRSIANHMSPEQAIHLLLNIYIYIYVI